MKICLMSVEEEASEAWKVYLIAMRTPPPRGKSTYEVVPVESKDLVVSKAKLRVKDFRTKPGFC